mmetsp:Transcript_6205/g.25084  ORF Transcript_6205/g.25084 Transcript_6205/m.25084 type:complete len:314 (-) Transcript_6205:55-996(-)
MGQAQAPGFFGRHVAEHGAPFVGVQPEQVVRRVGVLQPVVHRLLLRHKAAEDPIEHDQHAAEVLVDVLRVAAVVGAVVRGRVEDELEPGRHPVDPGGVHEELVAQVQRQREQHPARLEAQPHRRQVEQPVASDRVEPALPQRRAEVHPLRAVVHDMGAPEPADAMAGAVEAVVQELDEQEKAQKAQRRHVDREQPVVIHPAHGRQHQHGQQDQVRDEVAAAAVEAVEAVPQVEHPGLAKAPGLHRDGDHEEGRQHHQRQVAPVEMPVVEIEQPVHGRMMRRLRRPGLTANPRFLTNHASDGVIPAIAADRRGP